MLYPIAIERGDDKHAYGVEVPDLPGCFSAGDTLDEALALVTEAIEGHLEMLAESGAEIPQASPVARYVDEPEYHGRIWGVVEVDTLRYMGRAERVNITLPARLLSMIDSFVQSSGKYRSRSDLLARGAERLLKEGRG